MSALPGTLILACGNPSRGDDALGPTFVERLSANADAHLGPRQTFEVLTDFQLQIEHVLDLKGRARVVFVDAALSGPEPYCFAPVTPEPTLGITTHTLSPGGLLRVYQEVVGGAVPDCRLLAIRGYGFRLGAGLSPGAAANLEAALVFMTAWLAGPPVG